MKILVFGGSGLVGSKFIELYSKVFAIYAPLIAEIDILNKDQVKKIVEDFDPGTVINFAAFTNVEGAEGQKGDKNGICYLINAVGAKNVADVSFECHKKLIHISTEYVFDGTKAGSPYIETDKPNPINWYGQTKYFGEQFVLQSRCLATVMRICMPFSPFYELKSDVARFFLDKFRQGAAVTAIKDQRITPTIVSDIARGLKVLVEKGKQGIHHDCAITSTTPYEFAKLLANQFNLDAGLVNPISFVDYNKTKQGKLLKNSWLDSGKFVSEFGKGILHTVEESVEIFQTAVYPV